MRLARACSTFIILVASLMLLLLDTHRGLGLMFPGCVAVIIAAFFNLFVAER